MKLYATIQTRLGKATFERRKADGLQALGKIKPGNGERFHPKVATRHFELSRTGHERGEFHGLGGSWRLGFLVRQPAQQGRRFALAMLTPQGTAVVTVAGLQILLPIYKTVAEAQAKKD